MIVYLMQLLEAFGPEFIDQMSRRKMMKKTRKISGANAIFFNRFLRLSRGPVLDLSVSFFLGDSISLLQQISLWYFQY